MRGDRRGGAFADARRGGGALTGTAAAFVAVGGASMDASDASSPVHGLEVSRFNICAVPRPVIVCINHEAAAEARESE